MNVEFLYLLEHSLHNFILTNGSYYLCPLYAVNTQHCSLNHRCVQDMNRDQTIRLPVVTPRAAKCMSIFGWILFLINVLN